MGILFYFYDDYSTNIKGNRVFYINGKELTTDSSQKSYIEKYTYVGNDKYEAIYFLNGKQYKDTFTMLTKKIAVWESLALCL